MTSRRETVWLSGGGFAPVGIACLVAAVVFVFDVSLPLGVAGGVPYVALVLVGLWFPGIRVVYVLAVLGSVLTVAGYFLSASAVISWMVLTNRALALFAIWTTAILVSLRTREMGNKNALVSLLHRVTVAVNTAKGVEDAMQICLDEICAFTGWPIGHVYIRSEEHPGTLVPTAIWHIEDEARFANFRKVTQNTEFKAGEGLPGRILETKKAVWIRNVGEDPNFPRAKLTEDISSHAGFGVPVLFGDNVVAVLEFFSTEINDPDGAFLHVVANIGTHLGRLIERTRAEEALSKSEAHLRAVMDNAPATITLRDTEGRFLLTNKAFDERRGIGTGKAMGKTNYDLFSKELSDNFRDHDREVLETGSASQRETELHHVNGSTGVGLTVRFPIRDADNNVMSLGTITTDITERNRDEETRRQMAAMVETNSAGFVTADAEGKIVGWNRGAQGILGYAPDEAQGKPIFILVPPEREDEARQVREALTLGEATDGLETVRLHMDGRRVPVSLTVSPVMDEGGNVVGGTAIMIDITERKRAEEALRESEAHLRAVTDNSPTGIFLKDPEGRYLLANEVITTWLGTIFNDVLGRTNYELFPKDLADERAVTDREVIETRSVVRYELEEPLADGTQHIVDVIKFPVLGANGEVEAVGGISTDITERKRAEAALRASEERFKAFAESASDRFWEMDEGLRFTFHSGAPRVKSGFKPEETIGKTPWEIYGIDPDRDDHWRRHKEDLENHRPFRDFRHSFVDEGGQKYHWSVSGTPVFGKDGDFKGYSGTATNIGERVEAEEQLREAKEDAELANRAKSEFLSGMSHELRTPLNAIIGFSELIERESFGPLANDKYAEYVTDIHASGSHLLDLVNDILDIAAVESGRLELNEGILDVGAIAEAAFRMVKSHAETGGIELTRALDPHLSGLFADERKVKQIVLNLLTNAVKFTPEGGRVSFEARLEDDAMALVVADTGVGMNEDSLTKALTKFGQVNSQLSRNNQGTGLGLPLVKGLMEAHGGTLELTSEIGVGTTATVRFPKVRIVS